MTTPFSRKRRRGSLIATVFVVLGFVVTVPMLTYAAYDGQRIRSFAVEVDGDRVREVVDYDYGWDDLRGFTRDLPDGLTVSDVRVESTTAPTDVTVLGDRRITVGVSEPVTGRHRYLLSYRLEGGPVDAATLAGTWQVPVDATSALAGEVDLAGDSDDPSWFATTAVLVGLGTGGYVVGLIPVLWWARRAGRDRAWHGGGVDAVFGAPGMPTALIGDAAADRQVTVQFEPPRDLTPAQGGMLLYERVTENHRAAWLTQHALDGWVEFADGRLDRTPSDERWASAPEPLAAMFEGRRSISLGTYDPVFARGWALIERELQDWRGSSDLWDHAAEKRLRRVSTTLGVVAGVAAIAAAITVFVVLVPAPTAAYVVGTVAALFVGAGIGAGAETYELHIRTPQGFARRQLVEGFRRFLESSEGRHAREAAARDELRLYSAWAVALGELPRWNHTLEMSAHVPKHLRTLDATFVDAAVATGKPG